MPDGIPAELFFSNGFKSPIKFKRAIHVQFLNIAFGGDGFFYGKRIGSVFIPGPFPGAPAPCCSMVKKISGM